MVPQAPRAAKGAACDLGKMAGAEALGEDAAALVPQGLALRSMQLLEGQEYVGNL